MAAAANFAWVNRNSMTFLTRQAFAKQFHMSPDDLDMHVIYDVSHNIAKAEQHYINGRLKNLLVHRKVRYLFNPSEFTLTAEHYLLIIIRSFLGINPRISTASSSYPSGLPVDWTASSDWWHNGNLFLRTHRH